MMMRQFFTILHRDNIDHCSTSIVNWQWQPLHFFSMACHDNRQKLAGFWKNHSSQRCWVQCTGGDKCSPHICQLYREDIFYSIFKAIEWKHIFSFTNKNKTYYNNWNETYRSIQYVVGMYVDITFHPRMEIRRKTYQENNRYISVSYTHLDVYKRQGNTNFSFY